MPPPIPLAFIKLKNLRVYTIPDRVRFLWNNGEGGQGLANVQA